jgi:hypothetical protein
MQERERGRLAGAGCAHERDRLARQGGEGEVGDRRALAVIGERDALELDEAARPAGIDRGSIASGRSRTAGSASSTAKNSASRGASMNTRLTKRTKRSSWPTTMAARFTNITMSPIVARPSRCSQIPATKIASSASVVEARVITATTAHHDSTGICAASRRSTTSRSPDTSASTRAKPCTRAMLPSVSEARSARSV